MRSLKIIKESDLIALVGCISNLCQLNNNLFKNYEINNLIYKKQFKIDKKKFHIKNNIIQCMEFISIIAM